MLSEGRPPSCFAVIHRILSFFQWQSSTIKDFHIKPVDFLLDPGSTLICFDGAALANGHCCGAGGTLKIHPFRVTKWFLNCGEGFNTKAELIGLWASLFLASSWSLNHLLVLGDSRIIIEWINHKSNLQSVHIEGWKQQTRALANFFTDAKFHHIPRCHNSEADALSKRALGHVAGRLSVYHCDNGIDNSITTINIFES
jgi:ribonuclease HI